MEYQTGETVVHVDGVTKTFATRGGEGRTTALEGIDLVIRGGEFVSLIGPSGLRQEHAAAADRRPDRSELGERERERQDVARGAPRTRVRDRLPGAGPVRLAHGRGQREAATRAHRHGPRFAPEARPAAPGARRARRLHAPLPVPTFGRHAAARRDRAGAGPPARPAADGRAVRRTGRDDPRADEQRGAADLAADGDDDRLRHPLDSRRRSSSRRGSR